MGLRSDWPGQQRATARATAAAAGQRPDSDAAGERELQISRLDKLAGQLGEIRARLDGVAGDLAVSRRRRAAMSPYRCVRPAL